MSLPEATGELTSGPEVAVSTTMSFLVGGGLGLLGYGLGFRLNDLGSGFKGLLWRFDVRILGFRVEQLGLRLRVSAPWAPSYQVLGSLLV